MRMKAVFSSCIISTKPLGLTHLETSGFINPTPGIPGADKNTHSKQTNLPNIVLGKYIFYTKSKFLSASEVPSTYFMFLTLSLKLSALKFN